MDVDVGLSLLEKEFRKEYSSYRRLLDLLCDQEDRMKAICFRLGQAAVRNGLWHGLEELLLQEGEIAQVTLVRKDGTLVCMSPAGLDPKKLYEEEKELSKGFLFLVTINRAD